jgi:hypothetical protein
MQEEKHFFHSFSDFAINKLSTEEMKEHMLQNLDDYDLKCNRAKRFGKSTTAIKLRYSVALIGYMLSRLLSTLVKSLESSIYFYRVGIGKNIKLVSCCLPSQDYKKRLSSGLQQTISISFFLLLCLYFFDRQDEAAFLYYEEFAYFYINKHIWEVIPVSFFPSYASFYVLSVIAIGFFIAILCHLNRLNKHIKHNPEFVGGIANNIALYQNYGIGYQVLETTLFLATQVIVPIHFLMHKLEYEFTPYFPGKAEAFASLGYKDTYIFLFGFFLLFLIRQKKNLLLRS